MPVPVPVPVPCRCRCRYPLCRLLDHARDFVGVKAGAVGSLCNGGDRIHLWRVAAGSNSEVLAALDVATASGYVDAAAVAAAIGYQDRVGAMLYRLTH